MDAPVKNKPLEYNKPEVTTVPVAISAKQPYSQPFWLKEPHEPGSYNIPDQTLIGRADILPEVMARFDFTLNSAPFSITRAAALPGRRPVEGRVCAAGSGGAAVRNRSAGRRTSSFHRARRGTSVCRFGRCPQTSRARFVSRRRRDGRCRPPTAPFQLKEAGRGAGGAFPADAPRGTRFRGDSK